jgi:hypothetical protein
MPQLHRYTYRLYSRAKAESLEDDVALKGTTLASSTVDILEDLQQMVAMEALGGNEVISIRIERGPRNAGDTNGTVQ